MTTMVQDLAARLGAVAVNDNWGVEATALLLEAGRAAGASDIHVICQGDGVAVLMRCESQLHEVARLPLARRDLLLGRFKVMAKLPAFVRSEPQDGRIDWKPAGADHSVTIRAAFLPTIHGESLNLRFPETTRAPLALGELGMRADTIGWLERLLGTSEGALVVTGPSGSGKTTTLYACARWLNEAHRERMHLVTIEDPVERDLGFASQVQVDEAKGVTFAKGLRAALRQDPNALLIGEIRDPETARIAMQAGMTGHLVLSSIHAGRSAAVPTRLVSMGVDPFLVAGALSATLAQRLALRPEGGRLGVFELGVMTEAARDLVLARATAEALSGELMRLCPGSLTSEARRLVVEGQLTREAAARMLGMEEWDQ